MITEKHSKLDPDFRSLYDFFEKSFESGNFKELVSEFYTDDAVFEGHEMARLVGKGAILAAFESARAAGLSKIEIDASETPQVSGDLAYHFITNTNHFASGIEIHRALIIWRRTSEGWKCEVDFFCPKA